MKYYIINSDGNEVTFDLSLVDNHGGILTFRVTSEGEDKGDYFVKSVAGKNFYSKDKVKWSKLPKISSKSPLINITETLNVYQGFKPSGLSGGSAGELVSQMPGKIVKIIADEGAEVTEGDTLLILEAMKMENEIKAGVTGTIKAIHVEEGQVLESGHLMIEIEE